jgi:hypothetical protein
VANEPWHCAERALDIDKARVDLPMLCGLRG